MGVSNPFEIVGVDALQVLDSRGNPTVKVLVRLAGGATGWGISPSGASRGEREAVEVRDGGSRWGGRGVSRAVAGVKRVIAPHLVGLDARRQAYIDRVLAEIDGTPNKSRLGGNATTAVSTAVAKAAAAQAGLEPFQYLGGASARSLPIPILNVINGGVHAGNDLDFQEFLIVPHGFDSFGEALRAGVEVYMSLKNILKSRFGPQAVNVGDEGGFAPPLSRAVDAFSILEEAVSRAGYSVGSNISFGLDAAASQLYRGGVYHVEGKRLDTGGLASLYEEILDRFPIVYLEDPFHEDDVDGFEALLPRAKGNAIVVGDDLFTTNPRRIEELGGRSVATGLLVKVNQIGSVSEALDAIAAARDRGMVHIVSHRSGDTEDPFIADLAVASSSLMIKTGAPARGERTAKYNRLLEIEALLGPAARFSGPRLKAALQP